MEKRMIGMPFRLEICFQRSLAVISSSGPKRIEFSAFPTKSLARRGAKIALIGRGRFDSSASERVMVNRLGAWRRSTYLSPLQKVEK